MSAALSCANWKKKPDNPEKGSCEQNTASHSATSPSLLLPVFAACAVLEGVLSQENKKRDVRASRLR